MNQEKIKQLAELLEELYLEHYDYCTEFGPSIDYESMAKDILNSNILDNSNEKR